MRCPPALLLAAGGVAWGLAAGAEPCRLALVLALDVSSSVNASEDRLQREGLARALVAPEVREAFLAGEPVALFVFEWSGQHAQVALLSGWEMVESEAVLERIAEVIQSSRRSRSNLPTAVGAALGHAATQLRHAPDCRAKTVDLSGDGIHNDGFGPDLAYENFPFDNVTVNALVIGTGPDAGQVAAWFQAEVLHGPGAFSIFTNDYAHFEEAMKAKLLRELEMPEVSGVPAAGDAG